MLQTRQQRMRRPPPMAVPAPIPAPAAVAAGGAIPYDYAAKFDLRGEPGRLVQDVISIGPDADFTAVAISYAFDEDRRRVVGLQMRTDATAIRSDVSLGQITLDEIPPQALIDGVHVNPRLERLVFTNVDETTGTAARESLAASNETITIGHLSPASAPFRVERVLQRLKPRESLSFLFSIVDTTSGREMQDQPVHSLAALGNAEGERPFRLLARPATFAASSSIRFQVLERTPNVTGTLYIVLFGFKRLRACQPVPPPPAGSRVVPFDYVARLEMRGIPHRQEQTEIPICLEGGFTATAIGYGLEIPDTGVAIDNREDAPTVNLRTTALSRLPISAWVDGFRVRPESIRFAFEPNGRLNERLPADLADRIFERLNQPAAAAFRYRLFDEGRGVELQNIAIHNLAGLGTASGDRPFRQLPVPLRFVPRSSLRVTIEEIAGRGRLHIVLQGYRYAPDTRRAR